MMRVPPLKQEALSAFPRSDVPISEHSRARCAEISPADANKVDVDFHVRNQTIATVRLARCGGSPRPAPTDGACSEAIGFERDCVPERPTC